MSLSAEMSDLFMINAILREQSAAAFRALEPFASASVGPLDVRKDDDGHYWNGAEQRAAITTWFGPSDFGRAADAFLLAPDVSVSPEASGGSACLSVARCKIRVMIGEARTPERRLALQDALRAIEIS